jgi:Carboxypeptidase regulatory-like domain/TonB dependent receptor
MKRFLIALLYLGAFVIFAFGQSNTGNLVVTVSDASGVIAGATVTVVDNQSGKERTVVTGDSGSLTIPQLDIGTYTVTVKSQGHKTRTYPDVRVEIGQSASLSAMMDVGDVSEIVTVTGGAEIVNAVDGEIKTTVTGRQIVELPLNGRNPLSLVLLQAGSSSNSAQTTTINGQRSSFTNITRDGINVQDNFIRANAVDFIPDRPNVDDTGEFTIVTQNAGAESGYGASQVQLVTPRGSNDFHGAAYIYNRNSEFAANSFFNNFSRVSRPFLNRNQFGGKVSGPIWKNKLFFFFGYEGFRLRQSVTANRTILLPNARTGIFTFQDNSGVIRTANIFTLAAALPGGPPTGIDPVITSRILANLPSSGNNTTLGDQFNTTGLTLPITSNQDREAFSSRFDFDMNDKNSFSGVYTFKKELNQRTDLNAQQGGAACCFATTPVGFQDAHTPFLSLSWRWAPTNALSNELRGGYQLSDPIFGNLTSDPTYFVQVPLINNPETGFQGQGRRTDIINFQDNAVYVTGNHAIRFGGQYNVFRADPFGPGAFGAPYIPNYVLGGGTTPAFSVATFNTASGCVAATGVNCISSVTTANSLLALLGGLIGSANQTFTADNQQGPLAAVPPARKLNYEHYSFYGSDQWRVTPNFTLNFGLRYELFTPIREPNGLALEPVLNGRDVRTAILDPNGTYDFVGTNNGGTNFFKTDKDNIAPVVSFAWSPNFENGILNSLFPGNGKTVVRGGYRLSYVNDEFVRAADNALGGNAGLTTGLTTGATNARFGALPTFVAPALTVPRTYAQNNTLAGNFGTVFAIDPDLKVPGSHEFSIGIQREIGFDTAFEVRYVHAQSNNLARGLDFNQVKIDPAFLADFNRARSNLSFSLPANCTVATNGANCQPLQVLNAAPFNTSPFGNPLTFSNTLNPIRTGDVGELAFVYLATFRVGNNVLLANPNTGVVDLLTNQAKSRYNALQAEVRRRFTGGLTFQANYTFQKLLTDAPGTGQTRFEPLIDNAQPNLEYAIGDQDTTHVFNLNTIYELPFGKGKSLFSDANGIVDRIIGGWQATSIIRLSSGAPYSITDPRGTLNRAGRSGRQTANTDLTKEQVKGLMGVFRLPCGIFFINPDVINLDLAQCQSGLIRPRVAGTTAGVASLGFDPIGLPGGVKTFPGQVFFNVAPGRTGNMERNFLSGPLFFNWDASLIKNIPITERVKIQIRGEVFNAINRAAFGVTGQFTQANINSSTFGRLLSAPNPRILQFVGRIEF